jgi:hypothetical protein
MKRKIKDPVNEQIEREYYQQAQGRQINIMQIPALFRDARALIQQGSTAADAVSIAIDRYCEPVRVRG